MGTQGRRAAIYTRISADLEGQGLGVQRQQEALESLATTHRLEVVGTYRDNDRSAWNGKARPEFEQLLEDIRGGRVDVVLCWATDRVLRRLEDTITLLHALKPTGGIIISTTEGVIDPNTSEGEFRLGLMVLLARQESSRKSERVKAKCEQNAKAGKSHGGRRPFGWLEDRRTLDPTEAPIVREMAMGVLDGISLRKLAEGLNARGIPTVMGGLWSGITLRTMLLNPRLAGHRVHRTKVGGQVQVVGTYPGDWEPILTEDTWQRVRAILEDPARRTNRPGSRKYLLTGLVHCGTCTSPMVARPASSGHRRYVCTSDPGRNRGQGCGTVSILASHLEELVSDLVLEEAQEANLTERMAATIDEPATSSHIQARLEQLTVDWSTGDITRAEWRVGRESLLQQLEEVQAQEDQAHRQRAAVALVDDLASRWTAEDMDDDKRRAILSSLIDSITIQPAAQQLAGGPRQFDPDRVDVLWAA